MMLHTSQHIEIYLLVKKYCPDERMAEQLAIELISILEGEDAK
jgi:hypothetical protein